MNHYRVHLDSDESDLGIQHLSVNVDQQTYGVLRDFLLGKITLTPGPLPEAQEVSSSCSSE